MKFTILLLLINMIFNLKKHRSKLEIFYKFKFMATILRQEFDSLKLNQPFKTSDNVPIYMEVNTETNKVNLFALMKRSDAQQVIKKLHADDSLSGMHNLEFNLRDSKSDLTTFLFGESVDSALYRLLPSNEVFIEGDDVSEDVKKITEQFQDATVLQVDGELKGHITNLRQEAFNALKEKFNIGKNKPTSNIANVYDMVSHLYLTDDPALDVPLTFFINKFNETTKKMAARVNFVEIPQKFGLEENLKEFKHYFEDLAKNVKKEKLRKRVARSEIKDGDELLTTINQKFIDLVSKLVKKIGTTVSKEFKELRKTNCAYSGQITLFASYFKDKYLKVQATNTPLEKAILEFAGYVVEKQVEFAMGQTESIPCNDLIRFFKRLKEVLLKPKYSLPNLPEIGEYGAMENITGDTIVVPASKTIEEKIKEGFLALPEKFEKLGKLIPEIRLTTPIQFYHSLETFETVKKKLDDLVNSNKSLLKKARKFISLELLEGVEDKEYIQDIQLLKLWELPIPEIGCIDIAKHCKVVNGIKSELNNEIDKEPNPEQSESSIDSGSEKNENFEAETNVKGIKPNIPILPLERLNANREI
jgi:hypothetical protein